ncbi:MAG TPA: CsgG/HfaB family protein [Hymenobacter sp.]|jgi:curli production assembly/transport component CsgG|uniref:CsgG/HfaB family protein n=1 Tax=Hymenobacter sp. TaxID=1898978 RepID=UPI002ED9894B
MNPEPARLGAEISANEVWRTLPAARQRVVVAVYKFRDQTGQYKPQVNGSSFSTAVTQGATSVLLRALEESKWFDPIERENLGNLLNERKIIRSTRAEYTEQTGQAQPLLPPLLFAGIILEGGIISYDSNILTGGAGLRYFGAGASGQYRQDRVTVYLRAISTSTGKILKTVYTSKTILSQQVDASLFQFVKFKRLLETETGFTYNEPSEMAVKDAIEKSVQALIYEGIQQRIWAPADTSAQHSPSMQAYLREKQENLAIDVLGRKTSYRQRALGVGVLGGAQLYQGDYALPQYRSSGELTVRHRLGDGHVGTFLNAGYGALAAGPRGRYFNREYTYGELGLQASLFPHDRFTPYLLAGGGVTVPLNRTSDAGPRTVPHAVLGLGGEFLVTPRLGFAVGIDNRYYFGDQIDGVSLGRYNDYNWGGRAGVIFYLGKERSSDFYKK